MAPLRRGWSPRWIGLEWNHLEGDAKYLGDLFRHQSVVTNVVGAPPKTATDDLLTQQLRHERAQADDVRDRAAVPPLGEHADRDDAADIAAWRMHRRRALLCEHLEPLWIHRTS